MIDSKSYASPTASSSKHSLSFLLSANTKLCGWFLSKTLSTQVPSSDKTLTSSLCLPRHVKPAPLIYLFLSWFPENTWKRLDAHLKLKWEENNFNKNIRYETKDATNLTKVKVKCQPCNSCYLAPGNPILFETSPGWELTTQSQQWPNKILLGASWWGKPNVKAQQGRNFKAKEKSLQVP